MRKLFVGLMLGGLLLMSINGMNLHVSLASDSGLQRGDPGDVNMLQRPLDEMYDVAMHAILEREIPGAVVLVGKDETIVKHDAYGHAVRYEDSHFEESDNPVFMTEDTIFDLASISKLFTTTAAMKLYEAGKFELDDPVADHLPDFAENGKEDVTIKQLMTHTSGFVAWLPLESMVDNREDAIETVLTYPLANEPGTTYEYSDLNLITLGALIEEWSGVRLDEYMKTEITEPLGMVDTMYNPPKALHDRVAATAYTSSRGMIRGEVHDGNAYVLDGVAGHAGLFSTAQDLAHFSQMMLNKGDVNGQQILKPETIDLMLENHTPNFPGNDHGLGWELDQSWFMGALSSPTTMGHTGFTGTSIVINPELQTFAILLTNRVHPVDSTPSTNPLRQAIAQKTADAIHAWDSGALLSHISDLADDGSISSEAVHPLTLHLNAVNHYEKQGSYEKVIKHLEGMKPLLADQLDKQFMSRQTFNVLMARVDFLIEKLEHPNGVPAYEKEPVIGVLPRTLEVAPGEETELSIHGLTPNAEILDIDQSAVVWDVSDSLGEIKEGVFIGTEVGEGVITASYNDLTAKRDVKVAGNVIENIRHGIHPTYTRVVVDMNKNANYTIVEGEKELTLRIPYTTAGGELGSEGTIDITNSPVLSAIHYEFKDDEGVITLQLTEQVTFETPSFSERIVIDLQHE